MKRRSVYAAACAVGLVATPLLAQLGVPVGSYRLPLAPGVTRAVTCPFLAVDDTLPLTIYSDDSDSAPGDDLRLLRWDATVQEYAPLTAASGFRTTPVLAIVLIQQQAAASLRLFYPERAS